MRKMIRRKRLGVDRLNDGIGKESAGEVVRLFGCDADQIVSPAGRGVNIVDACEIADGHFNGLRGRIHHAWQWVNLDALRARFSRLDAECGDFEDRVCQKVICDAAKLLGIELAIDEIDAGNADAKPG